MSSKYINIILKIEWLLKQSLTHIWRIIFIYRSTPQWLNWISYLSWFSYGNEALNINQWSHVTNIPADSANMTRYKDGNSVLTFLNYDHGSIIVNCICMVMLLMFYRAVAFLGLLTKTFRKWSCVYVLEGADFF